MNRRNIQLDKVDLNLLVALQALLDTGSVTQAANRVGVTQSAMSHSLRRLRTLLGDDVLVRSKDGMLPTPAAEAMRDELLAGLLALQTTIRSTARFVPAQAERSFRICATDHAHLRFAPRLVATVGHEAPGVELHFKSYTGLSATEGLVSGALDVIVASELDGAPEQVMRELLGREQMICAVRSDHPTVGERLSLEQYAALPHIDVTPTDARPSLIDELLATHDLERRVVLRLQSFLISPLVLTRSDCILTAPAGVVEVYRRSLPLRVVEPPLELLPILTFLHWHERNQDDPAMRWLRASIMSAFCSAQAGTAA